MLYAFGSNGSAQLGVGHRKDLSSPQRIVVGNSDGAFRVKQFAAGGNHTAVLCEDGRLLVAGNNDDGRCGMQGVQQLDSFERLKLPYDSTGKGLEVRHVSASWSVTTFVFSDESVRTCGTGDSGELGLGTDVSNAATIQTLSSFPPPGTSVVNISSGMAHTVALLSNGEAYGWGKGRKGQIGEPAVDVKAPRKVEGLGFKAVKVICGKDFTLIVGEPSTGAMTLLGPIGADRFGLRASVPEKMPLWQDITTSWGSIFILTDSGDIVAWGRNDHGQLPHEAVPAMQAIAAGSEHCLGLTRDGRVVAWGWGEHGNCSTPTDEQGDVKYGWNEVGVPGRATRIFAGCATSFIETQEDVG